MVNHQRQRMMKNWFPYLLHNVLVSICLISRWNRKPLWAKYDYVNLNNIHEWFNPSLNTMMLTYFINWYSVFLCHNYNDVIMGTMASQITSLTIVCSVVHSMRRSNKTSKLRVTGLCVTGEFPAQRASNAENVSLRWRNHDMKQEISRDVSRWYRIYQKLSFCHP